MDDEVAGLLPTLERARSSFELPLGRPAIERRLAAVTVVARAQTRQAFDEKMELSLALAEKLPRSAPEPSEAFEVATHRFLASSSARRACSGCLFKPGYTDCVACHALGRVGDQAFTACLACEGVGWVRCTACEGTKAVIPAVIRRVEDRVQALRHTFVPDVGDELAGLVVQEVVERAPPDSLAFDLDARTAVAPYRSTDATPRDATFLGYGFEDALDRARTAVERLTLKNTLVRSEVRAWAWPLLHLAWSPDIAYVVMMRDGHSVLLRGRMLVVAEER